VTKEEILKAVAVQLELEPEDLEPEAFWVDDLGVEPIELTETINRVMEKLGVDNISEEEVARIRTVEDLVELIEEKQEEN